MENLQKWLENQIAGFEGQWAYRIQQGLKGPHIDRNSDLVYPSASMIKVLVLAVLCDSKLSWEEPLRLDRVPSVNGGGALQELRRDREITVREAARLMIVLSDNLATNLLIWRLDMAKIQQWADDHGLGDTRLQRFMMDAITEDRDNYLTVRDYNQLLWLMYTRRREPRWDEAWQILLRQQFRDRIPCCWHDTIIFAHKTGELDGVVHDGGIYESLTGVYSVIIFTSQLPNNGVAGWQMGKLGIYIRHYLDNRGKL